MKSANVKTEVVFVMDLLSQLRNGRLRVPKFQRPFVWGHDRVRRLLDSILRGYPIGSVFLWETSSRYENNDHVGPVKVVIDQPKEPTPVGYLLDGHQRLSTLMGTLTASNEELDSGNPIFRVYFNLNTKEFEHVRHPGPQHFPLHRLMDTSDFLDECEQIRTRDSVKAAERIKTARGLVETFQTCAVGVTKVFHHEIKEAIEAFTRLNTEGRRMTPDQIFFALTYQNDGFNLASAVDKLSEDVLTPKHYGDINRTALLRVILAALERDIYSRAVDWRKLVEEEENKLENTLDACRQNLIKALDFLHTRIGASSQKTLPYALQLVLLSEFFRCSASSAPTDEALATLEQWVWVSSFSGAFMVGSSARFNDAVDSARKLAKGESVSLEMDTPALRLPRRFHPKAARVRAFFLFLKSLGPLDPMTGMQIARILDNGFQDAVLLFRQEDDIRNDIANRVLLGVDFQGDHLDAFRGLNNSPSDERDKILKSHAISLDAWDALMAGDATRFVEARRQTLRQEELVFMKEKGITPPKDGQDEPEDLVDDSED